MLQSESLAFCVFLPYCMHLKIQFIHLLIATFSLFRSLFKHFLYFPINERPVSFQLLNGVL